MTKSEKNVLHIVYTMNLGGIEQSTGKLAMDQKSRGCDVAIVCLYKSGFIGQQLQNRGIDIIELNLRKGYGLFNLTLPLCRISKKRRTDVLFVHTTGVDIPVAICTLFYKFKKKFLTVRTIDQYKGIKKVRAKIEAKISNLIYNKIVAVSHAVAIHEKKNIGRHNDLLQVIWNGFDMETFAPKSSTKPRNQHLGLNDPVSKDIFVVGMGVQLKAFKDVPTAIRAAKVVSKLGNKVLFIVAGTGPFEKELRQMVFDLGIAEIFKFVGAINEMPAFLNAIDVLLLTSPFEGFPGIVIEAMACGKPVVSTDCGGVRDSVIDGQTGFIVPVGDDKSIANAIIKLYEDRELSCKMGQAGLKRARENFTLKKYTQAYWDLIIS